MFYPPWKQGPWKAYSKTPLRCVCHNVLRWYICRKKSRFQTIQHCPGGNFSYGIKATNLQKASTTIKMAIFLCLDRINGPKNRQFLHGFGRWFGRMRLYSRALRRFRALAQFTFLNVITSLRMLGHKKFEVILPSVLRAYKWPAKILSWKYRRSIHLKEDGTTHRRLLALLGK